MTPRPPPLLFAACLLFWGHYAGQVPVALVLGAGLEAARWIGWRWQLADRDFDRTVDLSNVLFIIASVYLFTRDGAHGIFSLMGWLPLLLYPLFLVQLYSERGGVPAGSLFLSLRRQRQSPDSGAHQSLDLGYPYLALCLVGAAASVGEDRWFYPLLVVLALWGLAPVRPGRSRPVTWLALVLVAGALGFAAHHGMRAMQAGMEELVMAWLGDHLWQNTDPYQSVSAIGHIGRLKVSDRIVLHVTGLSRDAPPLLLRQASYQRYAYGTWTAPQLDFESLSVGAGGSDWQLTARPAGALKRVGIAAFPRDGELLLALPAGTWRLEQLVAEQLLRNPLGTVKVADSPGFIHFEAVAAGDHRADLAPLAGDLDVPDPYREVVGEIVAELGLEGLAPGAAAARLQGFFRDNFRYSLWRHKRLWGAPPLKAFLTSERQGHCEYFASAGVLLLRAAGIPARYATGFAVKEYSPLVGHHVVRRRHAHSWVLAWDGTGWRELDFTPPVWAAAEAEQAAPWWQPVSDLLARARFAFESWRWREEATAEDWLLWLLPPLVVLLLWRLAGQRRVRRGAAEGGGEAPATLPDSPLMDLYPRLTKALGGRGRGETLGAWIGRCAGRQGLPCDELDRAVALHNRLRFGGEDGESRERLERLCAELASRLERGKDG